MFGWFVTAVLVILVLTIVLSVETLSPSRCWSDLHAPLNFCMYQQRAHAYAPDVVDVWIPKPWRPRDKGIPCTWETYPDATYAVLCSHGNAEDLQTCSRMHRDMCQDLKLNVLGWDYSGYGLNQETYFERSVDGINMSLRTLYEWLRREQGFASEHIIVWGYSLGTGPTLDLAAYVCRDLRATLGGVILVSAYTSILDTAEEWAGAWVKKCFAERWDNRTAIGAVTCPVLLMHGQHDKLIPAQHSKTLLNLAPGDAVLTLFPNVGHTSFRWSETRVVVQRWLKKHGMRS